MTKIFREQLLSVKMNSTLDRMRGIDQTNSEKIDIDCLFFSLEGSQAL